MCHIKKFDLKAYILIHRRVETQIFGLDLCILEKKGVNLATIVVNKNLDRFLCGSVDS